MGYQYYQKTINLFCNSPGTSSREQRGILDRAIVGRSFAQKDALRMTCRQKNLLRMTCRQKNLLRMTCTLFFSLSVFFTTFFLAGCVDFAANDGRNKHSTFNKTTYVKGEVYTMRGGLGGVFSKGMNQLEDTLENDYQIHSSSTVWYKANTLSNYIIKHYHTKKEHVPIILVGHSLGANEQIKVARNLAREDIPVALLVTIDAVSPLTVPPNVKQVVNIYKPSYVPLFSGLILKAMDPKSTHIVNLNITTIEEAHVNHFTIDKDKYVQKVMVDNVLAALKDANKK